jgi:hypothetical protein
MLLTAENAENANNSVFLSVNSVIKDFEVVGFLGVLGLLISASSAVKSFCFLEVWKLCCASQPHPQGEASAVILDRRPQPCVRP